MVVLLPVLRLSYSYTIHESCNVTQRTQLRKGLSDAITPWRTVPNSMSFVTGTALRSKPAIQELDFQV